MTASCCYSLGRQLYVHLTSQCTSTPLLLTRGPGLQRPDWLLPVLALTEDPPVADLVAEAGKRAPEFEACVLAGYGEPTARLEAATAVARALRGSVPVRLNTNGLGSVTNGRDIVPELAASGVSAVSVGLNAANEDDWNAIMAPSSYGGGGTFQGALDFVAACSGAGLAVEVSCVETPGVDVAAVERLARDLGASFRPRSYQPADFGADGLTPGPLHCWAAQGELGASTAAAFELDEIQNTALIWAAERGHLHVVERILQSGPQPAQLNAKSFNGNSAVTRAARRGHEEVLRRLLQAKASASSYNAKQQTPLHFAAFYQHRGCVELLLEAGSDTNLKDRKGRTPDKDTSSLELGEMIRSFGASSGKEPLA